MHHISGLVYSLSSQTTLVRNYMSDHYTRFPPPPLSFTLVFGTSGCYQKAGMSLAITQEEKS